MFSHLYWTKQALLAVLYPNTESCIYMLDMCDPTLGQLFLATVSSIVFSVASMLSWCSIDVLTVVDIIWRWHDDKTVKVLQHPDHDYHSDRDTLAPAIILRISFQGLSNTWEVTKPLFKIFRNKIEVCDNS